MKKNNIYYIIAIVIVLVIILVIYKRERFVATDNDEAYVKTLVRVAEQIYPQTSKITVSPGGESVTILKKRIYLCLKDKTTNGYYPFDVLLYVLLHELAHVESKSFSPSHNAEFKANFEKILAKARSLGYLKHHTNIPDDYCKI